MKEMKTYYLLGSSGVVRSAAAARMTTPVTRTVRWLVLEGGNVHSKGVFSGRLVVFVENEKK